MRTPVDARLAEEAARFTLRFACEDCVQFDEARQPACAHGWPVRLRRSSIEEDALSFCKEFELA
jgi:hypothetical protein